MARQKRSPHRIDEASIVDRAVAKHGKAKGRAVAQFSIILNDLLERKGIDQEQMASDLNISDGAISNYRNGVQEPGLTRLIAIAEYLGVDCHYLMTGVSAKDCTLSKQLGLTQEAINKLISLKQNKTHRGKIHRIIINGILSSPAFDEFLLYAGDAFAINEGAALGGFAPPPDTELSDELKTAIDDGVEAIKYANKLGDYSKVVYSGKFAVDLTCRNALSKFEKVLYGILGLTK